MNKPLNFGLILATLTAAASAQELKSSLGSTSRTVRTAWGTSATLSDKQAVIHMPGSLSAPFEGMKATNQISHQIGHELKRLSKLRQYIDELDISALKIQVPKNVRVVPDPADKATSPPPDEASHIEALTIESEARLQNALERDREIREDVEGDTP